MATANSKIVEYFRERKYKNPTDNKDSPWKYAAGTDMHYFDFIFAPGNEEHGEGFLNHMKFKTELESKWYETTPVEEILSTSCGASDVLLVDMGGNTGYDISRFHKAHPNLPGRLIVQDLPKSIDSINAKDIEPVEPMVHDFFKPQPIKGAKAYYLKYVLHDCKSNEGTFINDPI